MPSQMAPTPLGSSIQGAAAHSRLSAGLNPQPESPRLSNSEGAKALGGIGCLAACPMACSQAVWLILLSINAIGPASSDAYLPNLKNIATDLGTTKKAASATVLLNWVVLGVVNPLIGGLSDRYGRRPITMLALTVFIGGAIGSARSQTILQLFIARVVMGAGQAVTCIASAVIRDLVDDTQERMRILGLLSIMQPVMILAAPILGGQLGQLLGWRMLFWILAGWGGVTMLAVMAFVPETNKTYLRRRREDRSAGLCVQQKVGLLQEGNASETEKQDQTQQATFQQQLIEMFTSVPFVGLTLTAAAFMGGIRAMLCVGIPLLSAPPRRLRPPLKVSCSLLSALCSAELAPRYVCICVAE
jgi:MFS family permease